MKNTSTKIWTCKIGEVPDTPDGGDAPLRNAVVKAYRELTGQDDDFIFSGWGEELTEGERALVDEDKLSKYAVTCCARGARHIKFMTAKEADGDRDGVYLEVSGYPGDPGYELIYCCPFCGTKVAQP